LFVRQRGGRMGMVDNGELKPVLGCPGCGARLTGKIEGRLSIDDCRVLIVDCRSDRKAPSADLFHIGLGSPGFHFRERLFEDFHRLVDVLGLGHQRRAEPHGALAAAQ
jgi:hypothetical protein